MHAITLHQPWASWIAWGWKTIETRDHNRFRSLLHQRIAIHAGKQFDESAIIGAQYYLSPERRCAHEATVVHGKYPHGAILAMADVVNADKLLPSDSARALCPCGSSVFPDEDRFGIFLNNIVQLAQPVPCRGYQGIWTVDPDTAFAIDRCLAPPRKAFVW